MTDAAKSDDLEIEIEGDVDVEIVDDRPEEDKDRPRRADGGEPDIPTDDELEKYSEGVQKRIKKMTFQFHEERRQKEEAERLREEAIRFAETQRREAEELRKRLSEGQTTIIQQAKGRTEVQLEQAKAEFKRAYENGDADGLVLAQTQLTTLQTELDRLKTYRPAPVTPPAPAAQPASPVAPTPPPRALEWAKNNTWFQTDPELTGYAFGVHERLVRSGVDPNSETYYSQIDSAMRSRFPEKFDAPEPRTPARQVGSVVAPAGRSSPNTPRKVVLTQSQVALAKRLGVPLKEYAAQMMKEQNRG